MKTANKRVVVALAIIGGAVILAVGIALTKPDEKAESWTPAAEGFLAIATPCCTQASLWDALDAVTPDEQHARPASAAEAAHSFFHARVDYWRWRKQAELFVNCFTIPSGGETRTSVRWNRARCALPIGRDLDISSGPDSEGLVP